MKLPAAQKTVLGLLAAIAAAALCALPFLAVKKDIVYVYAKSPVPDSREEGFVRELKRLGYEVKLNSSSLPAAGTVGLWFRPPEFASQLETSPAAWNFIYNEDYYPFDWRGLKKLPIVLTPYRELYEHYARSNIRTAMFTLGVNTVDFYAPEAVFQPGYKVYPLVYYGDNNKSSPLAESLKKQSGNNKPSPLAESLKKQSGNNKPSPLAESLNAQSRNDTPSSLAEKLKKYGGTVQGSVWFMGRFWENGLPQLVPQGTPAEKGRELSRAFITAVYAAPETPAAKMVPAETAEAAAAGALVIMPSNSAVKEIYGDNVIMYEKESDFPGLVDYYLQNPEISRAKIVAAQKITVDRLSSAASARRFKEILDWLRQNVEP